MGAARLGRDEPRDQSLLSAAETVLHFGERGEVRLNRAMANCIATRSTIPSSARDRYLGEPLKPAKLWNPRRGCCGSRTSSTGPTRRIGSTSRRPMCGRR